MNVINNNLIAYVRLKKCVNHGGRWFLQWRYDANHKAI